MNIAIVDDISEEAEPLSALIREYAASTGTALTIHRFSCGRDFLETFRPYAYTAIFLDIYMDDMTGLDTASRIFETDRRAMIVFITSSMAHMPEAFALHAFDYIEKPAPKERVFKVMNDILMRQGKFLDQPRLTFSYNREDYSLPYGDIAVIQSRGHNLEITDEKGRIYTTRMTYSTAYSELCTDGRFLEINRGILINMESIELINDEACIIKGGAHFPLNLKNARKLIETWQNFKLDSIRMEKKRRRKLR